MTPSTATPVKTTTVSDGTDIVGDQITKRAFDQQEHDERNEQSEEVYSGVRDQDRDHRDEQCCSRPDQRTTEHTPCRSERGWQQYLPDQIGQPGHG